MATMRHLKENIFNEVGDFIRDSGLSVGALFTLYMDLQEQARFKTMFGDYIMFFSEELKFSH